MTYTSLYNPMEEYQNILTRQKELYAEQQSIAFAKWKDEKGYLLCIKEGRNEWGYKRQINQIMWSDWISPKDLYQLFLSDQNKQQS